MKITRDKVVVLRYVAVADGAVVDQSPEEAPLDYIQGMHMLLPRFEAEVEGLEAGDTFSFVAPPDEAYGAYDPALRFDLPKESFRLEGVPMERLLVVGRTLPMLNSEGQVCMAQIKEIKEETVNVDFNHPMAGKTLSFSGEILSVRDATPQELQEGLHGEFLPPEERPLITTDKR